MEEKMTNDDALPLFGSIGSHVCDASARETVRPTVGNWVWCIPGTSLEEDMPICVLTMSTDGPQCLRTNVRAPMHIRPWNLPYKEIAPRPADVEVWEGVYRSLMMSRRADASHDQDAAIKISQSVSAASRFLGAEAVACVPAVHAIRQDELFVGRSVNVVLRGWEVRLSGWIVSAEEPLQIVVADAKGRYRKIESYADCLGDGDATPVIGTRLRK